jgi:hypothetical protein
MTQDKEAFLDRWSRLKQQQPAQQAEPVVAPKAEEEPAPPLQPVEELKADSDFTPFMNPQVDPQTRRSALKMLFTDAHFNEPDLFEPYSADFTKGEPIPEKMLKAINRARDLAVKGPERVAEEERLAEEAQAAKAEAQAESAPAELQKQEPDDVPGRQDA